MTGGGVFALPAGAFTDDTSMALCLAESLVICQGFDPIDQLQRYLRWYRQGHWSSTGSCFDIGVTTRAALERFERTHETYPGDANPAGLGNGSLMRLAPLALAYARRPQQALAYAGEQSRTTHGAREAVDACRVFAALLVGALHGTPVDTLLSERVYAPLRGQDLPPALAAVVAGSYRSKQPPLICGSGYVVASLEAALWALYSTSTFADAVLAAANLGDDADTTAAICGQLAGALYGVDAIPEHWRQRVFKNKEILMFADDLLALALREP
jgi:ADP-ribosylglycohydrolase